MRKQIAAIKEDGFSLLEVLIGLILMTAISLMFMGYMAGTAQRVNMSREMSEANRLMDNEVERLLAYSSTTPSTTLTDFSSTEGQALLADRVVSTNRGNYRITHELNELYIDEDGNVSQPTFNQEANIIEVTIEVRPLRSGRPTETGVVRTIRLR